MNNIIIPGQSIGGISLGDNISLVIDKLDRAHAIARVNPSTVKVDGGTLTIYHNPKNGCIESISANKNFKGNYKGKLWPGMNVDAVLKHSTTQIAWCGFVQVDGIKGVGLSLPNEFDDFEALTDFLDKSFIFDELWVYSFRK
ncbi:hypothetical protein [Caballeronia temeraria]|uniref:hypothetical protein n=1 Tax=Caballeronia temeraria TaxID=1777137 RepID=UPI0007C7901C|nr:hypothetical protein [Caballeronia temeraria]